MLTLFFAPSNPILPDVPLEIMVRNRTVEEEWTKLSILPENYCAGVAEDRVWAEGVITQQHKKKLPIQMKKGSNEVEICFMDGISVLEKLELEPANVTAEDGSA